MRNFSWGESKNFSSDSISPDHKTKAIRKTAIEAIDRFLINYKPASFFEAENFFRLAPMWVYQCYKCCKELQAKLKHIAESKFRKNFSGKMVIMREKIEAINDLIAHKADKETIKKSVLVVISQLTEILIGLREELREKL